MITINSIKKELLLLDEVAFAYLFGSFAKNTQTEMSDLDIAVYLKNDFDSFDTKLKIHHHLEITFHKEIDLIILNSIKNFDLLEDILNDGIVVKESIDDARVMYELYKEHEIIDYHEFKRILDVA